jgi:chemotaxis response regulator CheB
MPPTPPIGSESVDSSGTTSTSASPGEATAAPGAGAGPAGPGEDRYEGDREAVDSVGATSESPVGKIAGAAADAAKQAGAKLKEAAQQADLDEFADQAKRVTSDWSTRIKEEYQRRPGVVIGAAVGGVVLLAAIARGLGRRR